MADCQDVRCTRIDGKCVGMHCTYCGEPCSSQGHPQCHDDAIRDEAFARTLNDHAEALARLRRYDECKETPETFNPPADS